MSKNHKNLGDDRFHAFQEVALKLIEAKDNRTLLDLIVDKAMALTNADAGSLYLKKDEKTLYFMIAKNRSQNFEFKTHTVPIDGFSVTSFVYRTGKGARIKDVYQLSEHDPYQFDSSFDKKTGYRTRSTLSVPLKTSKGDIVGVIQLINRKNDSAEVWDSKNPALIESMPEFGSDDEEIIEGLAALASASLEKTRLYESIERLFEGFIRSSVMIIEERDPSTRGHSERVALMTTELARESQRAFSSLSFSAEQLKEIYYAGLLHDFGKIGVKEAVLLKETKLYDEEVLRIRNRVDRFRLINENGLLKAFLESAMKSGRPITALELKALEKEIKLNKTQADEIWNLIMECNQPSVLPLNVSHKLHALEDITFKNEEGIQENVLETKEIEILSLKKGSLTAVERREIEDHVTKTYRFLQHIPWTSELAHLPEIAYCHHEKLDGSGYPRKMKEDKIPVQSKMMTICDIFDALVAHDRPYKKALSIETAMAILGDECRQGKLDPLLFKVFQEKRVFEICHVQTLHNQKKAA